MSRWHERDFDAEEEAATPRRGEKGGLLSVLARLSFIAASLAVVAASILYGFHRSAGVTDEASLPLIKADPRPTKSRPAQPGGMEVPNQDKLVFDRLDPGAAPPMVERLLPPPEAPMPRPVAPVAPPPAADPAKGASRMAMDTVMAPPPASVPLKSGLPDEETPPPPVVVVPPAPATPTPAKPPPAATPAPAPTRPAAKAPAATAPAATPKPVALPPPSGGPVVRIQVGAVPREADAQTEWKRLQSRHRDLLGGLSLTVVRADLGDKGVYFRLQAGPVDEARARAICDQLKSQNVGCQLARN
ncbi:MAG: SPOR domain-containing protein [Rhodospirillaceae bacterium]